MPCSCLFITSPAPPPCPSSCHPQHRIVTPCYNSCQSTLQSW
jgi:hypothetical protein